MARDERELDSALQNIIHNAGVGANVEHTAFSFGRRGQAQPIFGPHSTSDSQIPQRAYSYLDPRIVQPVVREYGLDSFGMQTHYSTWWVWLIDEADRDILSSRFSSRHVNPEVTNSRLTLPHARAPRMVDSQSVQDSDLLDTFHTSSLQLAPLDYHAQLSEAHSLSQTQLIRHVPHIYTPLNCLHGSRRSDETQLQRQLAPPSFDLCE